MVCQRNRKRIPNLIIGGIFGFVLFYYTRKKNHQSRSNSWDLIGRAHHLWASNSHVHQLCFYDAINPFGGCCECSLNTNYIFDRAWLCVSKFGHSPLIHGNFTMIPSHSQLATADAMETPRIAVHHSTFLFRNIHIPIRLRFFLLIYQALIEVSARARALSQPPNSGPMQPNMWPLCAKRGALMCQQKNVIVIGRPSVRRCREMERNPKQKRENRGKKHQTRVSIALGA